MGLVTLHLVVGIGIFILPLFLLFFTIVTLTLAHLYIVIGAVSFVGSVITTIVLLTKFVNQPAAHGFFSYSDTIASALMSLGLMLDGVMNLLPSYDSPCYQYRLIYGLFVVPIITSFFSVLGMAIERFQAFALFRDKRKLTRKFSIAWFLSSWTLAICFLVILMAQISEDKPSGYAENEERLKKLGIAFPGQDDQFYVNILDMDLFPGPHSEKRGAIAAQASLNIQEKNKNEKPPSTTTMEQSEAENMDEDDVIITRDYEFEEELGQNNEINTEPYNNLTRVFLHDHKIEESQRIKENYTVIGIQCRISSKPFIMYYLILLFLLCFATPVLITTSLNVFIFSAVQHTTYEVIAHHQWLTLAACVFMWGPSITERLLAKWEIINPPLVVSVFLFLLGHTHNLLRSVLHAVFAQQIHSITWTSDPISEHK